MAMAITILLIIIIIIINEDNDKVSFKVGERGWVRAESTLAMVSIAILLCNSFPLQMRRCWWWWWCWWDDGTHLNHWHPSFILWLAYLYALMLLFYCARVSIILIAVITRNTGKRTHTRARRLHPKFCMFQVSFRRMICLHAMWHMGQDLISFENNIVICTHNFSLSLSSLCLYFSSFWRWCVLIPCIRATFWCFFFTELPACRFDAVIVELFPNDTK